MQSPSHPDDEDEEDDDEDGELDDEEELEGDEELELLMETSSGRRRNLPRD